MPLASNPKRNDHVIFCRILEDEKRVMKEVEEKLCKYIPRERVVELSLNRGIDRNTKNDDMTPSLK